MSDELFADDPLAAMMEASLTPETRALRDRLMAAMDHVPADLCVHLGSLLEDVPFSATADLTLCTQLVEFLELSPEEQVTCTGFSSKHMSPEAIAEFQKSILTSIFQSHGVGVPDYPIKLSTDANPNS